MTTPGTTSSPEASTVLGPDPDRPAGGSADPAALQETLEQVQADMLPASDDVAAADGDVMEQPTVGAYRDGDGRVHYASPYSKATVAHVDAGEWTAIDPNEPPFDPTDKRVRDVVAYLEQHAGDQAEIDRVKAAEAAGENRPTIAAWSPDPQ